MTLYISRRASPSSMVVVKRPWGARNHRTPIVSGGDCLLVSVLVSMSMSRLVSLAFMAFRCRSSILWLHSSRASRKTSMDVAILSMASSRTPWLANSWPSRSNRIISGSWDGDRNDEMTIKVALASYRSSKSSTSARRERFRSSKRQGTSSMVRATYPAGSGSGSEESDNPEFVLSPVAVVSRLEIIEAEPSSWCFLLLRSL
mmetsp:Transcript_14835/g.41308  ORF Transcript_14835/g.41308 Transcript_14835/m.41308 type:complete len:202 (-) Transcript_14835:886-1491(-)